MRPYFLFLSIVWVFLHSKSFPQEITSSYIANQDFHFESHPDISHPIHQETLLDMSELLKSNWFAKQNQEGILTVEENKENSTLSHSTLWIHTDKMYFKKSREQKEKKIYIPLMKTLPQSEQHRFLFTIQGWKKKTQSRLIFYFSSTDKLGKLTRWVVRITDENIQTPYVNVLMIPSQHPDDRIQWDGFSLEVSIHSVQSIGISSIQWMGYPLALHFTETSMPEDITSNIQAQENSQGRSGSNALQSRDEKNQTLSFLWNMTSVFWKPLEKLYLLMQIKHPYTLAIDLEHSITGKHFQIYVPIQVESYQAPQILELDFPDFWKRSPYSDIFSSRGFKMTKIEIHLIEKKDACCEKPILHQAFFAPTSLFTAVHHPEAGATLK